MNVDPDKKPNAHFFMKCQDAFSKLTRKQKLIINALVVTFLLIVILSTSLSSEYVLHSYDELTDLRVTTHSLLAYS